MHTCILIDEQEVTQCLALHNFPNLTRCGLQQAQVGLKLYCLSFYSTQNTIQKPTSKRVWMEYAEPYIQSELQFHTLKKVHSHSDYLALTQNRLSLMNERRVLWIPLGLIQVDQALLTVFLVVQICLTYTRTLIDSSQARS